MFIVNHRKIFFIFSGILILASLLAVVFFGLNLGTDFTGGMLAEVEYKEARPALEEVKSALSNTGFGNVSVQPTGERGLTIKSKNMSEVERENLYRMLSLGGQAEFTEERLSEVGPTLGKELRNKGAIAIILVVILIIIYIAFVFRQVSKHHVKSWKYGLAAIAALAHDIIISAGAMALLAYFSAPRQTPYF